MTVKELLIENLALRGLTHLQAEEVLDNSIEGKFIASIKHHFDEDAGAYSADLLSALWSMIEPATRQYIETNMPEHHAARVATN